MNRPKEGSGHTNHSPCYSPQPPSATLMPPHATPAMQVGVGGRCSFRTWPGRNFDTLALTFLANFPELSGAGRRLTW